MFEVSSNSPRETVIGGVLVVCISELGGAISSVEVEVASTCVVDVGPILSLLLLLEESPDDPYRPIRNRGESEKRNDKSKYNIKKKGGTFEPDFPTTNFL